jgi:hypothetical protein
MATVFTRWRRRGAIEYHNGVEATSVELARTEWTFLLLWAYRSNGFALHCRNLGWSMADCALMHRRPSIAASRRGRHPGRLGDEGPSLAQVVCARVQAGRRRRVGCIYDAVTLSTPAWS